MEEAAADQLSSRKQRSLDHVKLIMAEKGVVEQYRYFGKA